MLDWARPAGFTGDSASFDREFRSTPSQELEAIAGRAWPALRALDEGEIEAVTRPAVSALRALPEVEHRRRMTAEMLVLRRARERVTDGGSGSDDGLEADSSTTGPRGD